MKLLLLALCCVASASAFLSGPGAAKIQGDLGKVKGKEVDIVYTVFKQNPDIYAKFTKFSGKTPDDIKSTPEFATLAKQIIGTVGDYGAALGDDAKVKAVLDKMASTHKPRGVTAALYKSFQKTVTSYLGVSGPEWDQFFSDLIAYVA
ncbi:hypothetical protein PVAND_009140 [Polypedilum vanderplanki]|uniref:Globin n=1 Tax=Polypedilum vanderplanki TaxID=319348 RepID=S6CDG5_POLVA|nr:hypothetical protein PVAND_009140 [Polypedilum vanderplanki]BAN67585.1 globin [Polypedilum vanderplanki]